MLGMAAGLGAASGLIGGIGASNAAEEQIKMMEQIAQGYGKLGQQQYDWISPWMEAGTQALGALSNAEGQRVLDLIAKIDVTQSPEVVLQSINDIKDQYARLMNANAQDAAAMGYSMDQLDAYLQDEAARDAEARAKAEAEAKAEEKAKSEVEARKKAALSRMGDDELLGGL